MGRSDELEFDAQHQHDDHADDHKAQDDDTAFPLLGALAPLFGFPYVL